MWKALIGVFLTVGLGVAVFSVYKASVDGFMKQVGLFGSDFRASIVTEKISQAVNNTKLTISCDLPTRLTGTVRFMLSGEEEQGRLSFRLGESRIRCGSEMLANGQAETGTYEILKGIGYLDKGYRFVRDRAMLDRRVCDGLPDPETSATVSHVLSATSGRVYELIWSSWQEVDALRNEVDQACLDQRQKTR